MIYVSDATTEATMIPNSTLLDARLSIRAKGMLVTMLATREKQGFQIATLARMVPDGECAVRSALDELVRLGYLQRKGSRNREGRFSQGDYVLYDSPRFPENPNVEKPRVDFPHAVNPQTDEKRRTSPDSLACARATLVIPTNDHESVSVETDSEVCTPNDNDTESFIPVGEVSTSTVHEYKECGNSGGGRRGRARVREKSASDERFTRFFDAYPKKFGREQAYNAFRSLCPSDELYDLMLASLEEHKKSEVWTKNRGRYIPNAGNWILSRMWEMHLEPPEQTESGVKPDERTEKRGGGSGGYTSPSPDHFPDGSVGCRVWPPLGTD